MTISTPPAAPSTLDPASFATKADALLAWLGTGVSEINAAVVAMNLNSTTDTSTSSVAIGTGSKSFTVSTGKSFQPGMYLVLADAAAPSTNSIFAQITSYNTGSGALVVESLAVRGSGTKTSWVISQSSAGGAETGANSTITSLTGLTSMTSIPPMTVFGGAATRMAIGTGLNANILATTTPIRLSFPGGIGANGRIDYPGSITADATAFWATLTASSTLYTFYDRNTSTGAITGVFSTLPYILQDSTVAVSVVSGQHTYVTDTNTMYVGNGSVATAVQRIPEGELVTSGAAVTSVTSYAKLRKFTQAWVAMLPGLSTSVSANHNLGTQEFDARFEIECTTNDAGFLVGERFDCLNAGASGASYWPITIKKLRNSASIGTGDAGKIAAIPAAGGVGAGLTAGSWKYRFVCTGKV